MGILDGTDVVRIGSKTYTRNRAVAMGLVAPDRGGEMVLTAKGKALADTQASKIARGKAAERAWKIRQGIPVEEPETTEDGILKPRKPRKPLVPKNVTKKGEVIVDEQTLAEIAAKTAAVEKAHLAALGDQE